MTVPGGRKFSFLSVFERLSSLPTMEEPEIPVSPDKEGVPAGFSAATVRERGKEP
jgi:hypothetical protein